MENARLRGVYCPVLTPFDQRFNPDVDRFIEHCKNLLDQGCHGLAVFGTTDEANSLSVNERIRLLDAVIQAGIPAEVIAPGTGCSALTDTLALTRHAFEAGCGGVLMLPPFYYKSVEEEGLFNSFSTILEDIADSRLKVYLYHIPPVSNIPLEIALVKRLAEAYPDNMVGLKDSSGIWAYTETLLKTLPGFGVFSGSEVFLQRNLMANGCGTITASANVNATPY
jgi:4-hydroxy-tetrahydrodipicolinate synthase